MQNIIYDIEGAGSGSTTITLSTDYNLPIHTYWRKVTVTPAAAQKVFVPINTKTIIEDAIINNLFIRQGTAWVRGTSALNTSVVITDVGRLVINGTVTSSVADQSDSDATPSGILIRPGRVDILPGRSWAITATSNGSSPSAPVVVFGGGVLSNSGSVSVTSNGSTQLNAGINVVPGGIIYMNNSTLTLNSGSSTIAGGGATTQKGAIVLGGEMYMVNSGLLFPGGTSANVAGVMMVDGGKLYLHANSYIGSSGTPAQRPAIGVYDNGGSYIGGSTAGYTSGANGEGGGARSNIYATTKCWDGNGDANNGGVPSARYRHLFIDSDEGNGLFSTAKDTNTSTGTVNLLTYTADLSTGWNATNGTGATTTVTGTRVAAPDGSNSAVTITSTRGATTSWTARRFASTLSLTGQHTATLYLRAATPGDVGKEVEFWQFAGSQRNITKYALTASWARVTMNNSFSFTGSALEPFNIGLLDSAGGGTSSATTVAFDVWGAQLEAGASATTYSDVGAAGTGGVADYRHLRITNSSDWQCTR
jgi:hypothetical protein